MRSITMVLFLLLFCCVFNLNAKSKPKENNKVIILEEFLHDPMLVADVATAFDFYVEEPDRIRKYNIQTGIWRPVGGLAKIFTGGATVGIRFPLFSFFPNYLDMGLHYSYPFRSYQFGIWKGTDMEGNRTYEMVKGIGLLDWGLWFRNKKRIGNIYWNRYAGFGLTALLTDKKNEYSVGEYDEYYDKYYLTTKTSREGVYSLFINFGMDFRYKMFGVFGELNNTFYGMASGPPQIDGGLSLKVGFNLKF